MKDIVCAGCSFTNFDILDERKVIDGLTPQMDGVNPLGSYPEAIHRNFKNKVYNLGMAGNNISTSVLSLISTADRLLNDGRDISIILQCTEFTRQSFYLPTSFQIRKDIGGDNSSVRNNNYLFDGSESGFFQFGSLNGQFNNFSPIESIQNIARAFSEHIYSIEYAYIDSLTHILLLQNYCKVNKIPYKIFCKTESFSIPFSPVFSIDNSNIDEEFKSIFIDKKFPPKKPFSFINSDPYIKNLFGMVDLDNFWFLDDINSRYGGITEWVYLRNEYKEGDEYYTPLVVEDIDGTPTEIKPMFHINRAKEKIAEGRFNPNGHPTYYYWNKFVNSEITKWEIL
jgi:hypothetical protein